MADGGFGDKLKQWRGERGLTQADLDKAIGKNRGHIAQIETGRLKPPEMPLCARIADVLGLDPVDVWEAAAPERLERFDSDLLDWHRRQVNRARELPLSDEESTFVQELRRLRSSDSPESVIALIETVLQLQAAIDTRIANAGTRRRESASLAERAISLDAAAALRRLLEDLIDYADEVRKEQRGAFRAAGDTLAYFASQLLGGLARLPPSRLRALMLELKDRAALSHNLWLTSDRFEEMRQQHLRIGWPDGVRRWLLDSGMSDRAVDEYIEAMRPSVDAEPDGEDQR